MLPIQFLKEIFLNQVHQKQDQKFIPWAPETHIVSLLIEKQVSCIGVMLDQMLVEISLKKKDLVVMMN